MPSQIRPNRPEVSDRFPMLGFTIKTDGENKRYEVVVASDATLFRVDAKERRTKSNFYSSRAVGLQPIATGEAIHILPQSVLARFVGQEKLYYAVATYAATNGANPEVVTLPSDGSPYISLRGLTGRSLQRVRVLPSRQRVAAGYGNGAGSELEWGGDLVMPSTVPIASPSTPAPSPNGSEIAANSQSPVSSNSPAVNYTDGYGPLPQPAPEPAAAPSAQSLTGALGYDVELIPQPDKTSCWAAAMAMLVGYRRAVSISPETLAQEVGRSLRTSYGWDMLEAVKDHFGFQDISLPSNASLYLSPEQWQEWLNTYGPLWVTTVGAPSHAIIVTGLSGDLTHDGTTVCILNPWDTTKNFSADPVDFDPFNPGRAYTQSFTDFAADFGNLGLDDYGRWRVLYLPPLYSGSQGLGVSTRRTAVGATRALNAVPVDVHWSDVELVPEMPNVTSWASALAMIIGWRDRVSIDPATVSSLAPNPADRRSLADAWSMTTEAAGTYAVSEMEQMLTRYGPLWAAGPQPTDQHAFAIVGICGDGTPDGTIVCIKDPWGNVQGSPRAPQQNPTAGQASTYTITYRELARQYDPGVSGGLVASAPHLLLIHSRSSDGREPGRVNCSAPPSVLGLSSRTVRSKTLSNESFSINWDEVELIPQPTSNSCWATAGAMVVGWRDRVSISADTVAQIAGRTTKTGIYPNEHCPFGTDIGLVCEPPQSYSVEGFRSLLESCGPLWVGIILPGSGHAIVVTGMYSDGAPDGSDTYVRISDPWDRVVGSPGTPGNYLNTHDAGSRYIMRWADFLQEYEDRATSQPDGTVNIQILHSGDNGGRQPGRSGGVGYAMSSPVEDINSVDDDGGGIEEGIPVSDSEEALTQAYTRALNISPEYPQASRFAPAAPVNYRRSRAARTINRVVIHITDGGTRINGTIGWFQNPNQLNRRGEPIHVSAHYVIGQDGEVVQMVPHNDVAWHANRANGDSIGIEHVANTRGLMPSDAQYCASAALTRWLCDTYNLPIDRTHVLGHSEADTRTSHTNCPNAVWNWDHYMQLVQSASCEPQAQAAGLSVANSYRQLPPPPPRILVTRAMDAGVVQIPSTIRGALMERVAGQNENIKWQLDQLRGLKHPDDIAPTPGARLRDASMIRLEDWPYLNVDGGTISAGFTVAWQFNGKSVGNVQIANVGSTGGSLGELFVEALIEDDPVVYPTSNPTYAAVSVVFTYRFKEANGNYAIAKTRLRLFGEGSSSSGIYEKESTWERR